MTDPAFTAYDAASLLDTFARLDLTTGEAAALDHILSLATEVSEPEVAGFGADPLARTVSLLGTSFKVEIEGVKTGSPTGPQTGTPYWWRSGADPLR